MKFTVQNKSLDKDGYNTISTADDFCKSNRVELWYSPIHVSEKNALWKANTKTVSSDKSTPESSKPTWLYVDGSYVPRKLAKKLSSKKESIWWNSVFETEYGEQKSTFGLFSSLELPNMHLSIPRKAFRVRNFFLDRFSDTSWKSRAKPVCIGYPHLTTR